MTEILEKIWELIWQSLLFVYDVIAIIFEVVPFDLLTKSYYGIHPLSIVGFIWALYIIKRLFFGIIDSIHKFVLRSSSFILTTILRLTRTTIIRIITWMFDRVKATIAFFFRSDLFLKWKNRWALRIERVNNIFRKSK